MSALVTLFANILQNPQDARARSDVKLMNQVVNFLSLLSVDEENGGVKRMLGVCSEFERIAKVVLDKAEKESHSRRKRKVDKNQEETSQKPQQTSERYMASHSPLTKSVTTPSNVFDPNFGGDLSNRPFNPSLNGFSPILQHSGLPLLTDYNSGSSDFASIMTSSNGMTPSSSTPSFSDNAQQYTNGTGSPLNMGSFQQPFVPQDLWQMPMTLEWDWADMTGINYPAFDSADGGPAMPPNGQ